LSAEDCPVASGRVRRYAECANSAPAAIADIARGGGERAHRNPAPDR